MIRRPPRSTLDRSSAASDVYKRQKEMIERVTGAEIVSSADLVQLAQAVLDEAQIASLSLIHISEPTRPY